MGERERDEKERGKKKGDERDEETRGGRDGFKEVSY